MTDKELEKRLAQAAEHAAPNDLKGVLSRCGEKEVSPTPAKKKKGWNTKGLIAACLALVLVGGGGGIVYQRAHAVASVISLDVNPSIELRVNRDEKVLSCTALNEEAKEALAEMGGGTDLEGAKLEVAVNAVVGALVRHGYLDGLSSAILVSVEDKDQARAARMEEELRSIVSGFLQAEAPNAAVLSQNLEVNADLDRRAQESNISVGKAALVDQVLRANGTLTFQEAAALTVAELDQLLQAGVPGLPIGMKAAAATVRDYADVMALSAVEAKVEPELDETPAHYEVDLYVTATGEKYEYKVDAYTGEVLSGRSGILKADEPQSLITQDQALAIASEHSLAQYPSLAGYNIFPDHNDLDWEDGRQVYKLEFFQGGYEFEYEIDALTGAVLDWEADYKSMAPASAAPALGTPAPADYIGEEAAKAAALKAAGCAESDTTYCNSYHHYDDGRPECYRVEFMMGESRYVYCIDHYTGTVLSCEQKMVSDHYGHNSGHHGNGHHGGAAPTDIGEAAAKNAAFAHCGCDEIQVTGLKTDRDYEDNCLEYEIEFVLDGREYEYVIDGATGEILKYEWED